MKSLEQTDDLRFSPELENEIKTIITEWSKQKDNLPYIVMHLNNLMSKTDNNNDVSQIIDIIKKQLPTEKSSHDLLHYLDKLYDQHRAVEKNWQNYKHNQANFVKDYFSYSPQGEINIINDYNSIIIQCHNRRDFMNIYQKGIKNKLGLLDSEKIFGVYLLSTQKLVNKNDRNLPELTGCVIIENYFDKKQPSIFDPVSKYFNKHKHRNYAQSESKVQIDQKYRTTILHEKQHQWNDFFNKHNPNEPGSTFITGTDLDYYNEQAKSFLIIQFVEHYIKNIINKIAKEEILADFIERKKITKTIAQLDSDFEKRFIINPEIHANQIMNKINIFIKVNSKKFDNNSEIHENEIKLLIPKIYQKIYPNHGVQNHLSYARSALDNIGSQLNTINRLQIIGKVIDKDILEWKNVK